MTCLSLGSPDACALVRVITRTKAAFGASWAGPGVQSKRPILQKVGIICNAQRLHRSVSVGHHLPASAGTGCAVLAAGAASRAAVA